jgi:hypothetical protein
MVFFENSESWRDSEDIMKASRAPGLFLLGLLATGLCSAPARAQFSNTEREIRSDSTEKSDVWMLDFKFKDPRIIKVHIPGQGTRVYWYLWYQVINRSGEPQRFVPSFEIVTIDFPGAYPDRFLPTVKDAIAKLEDPTGYQNIQDSVSISKDKIPVSKPDAAPRAITGVAIWEAASIANPNKRDPNVRELIDSTRFSIFVRGLSNGFVLVDPLAPKQPTITRYKTLQLKFRKTGDRASLDSRTFSFQAPAEWQYRPGNTTIFGTTDTKDKK